MSLAQRIAALEAKLTPRRASDDECRRFALTLMQLSHAMDATIPGDPDSDDHAPALLADPIAWHDGVRTVFGLAPQGLAP